MIEMLDVLERGTCRNCGGPITHYQGDLGSNYWSHDETGKQSCPDAPMAEPVQPETEQPCESVSPSGLRCDLTSHQYDWRGNKQHENDETGICWMTDGGYEPATDQGGEE